MADTAFNGTTVKFGAAAIAGIKRVQYRGSCARVPITGSDAAIRLFKPGIPSESLTVEAIGSSALVKGTTGAVDVAWADGGDDGSMAKGRIMKKPTMSGSLDGPNTSTIDIKPSK